MTERNTNKTERVQSDNTHVQKTVQLKLQTPNKATLRPAHEFSDFTGQSVRLLKLISNCVMWK